MDRMIQIGVIALAVATMGACASGTRMGWQRDHPAPTAVAVASCDKAVKSLDGKPDHDIAMRACVDTKTRQGVD